MKTSTCKNIFCNATGRCSTIPSAYAMYGHLELYFTDPLNGRNETNVITSTSSCSNIIFFKVCSTLNCSVSIYNREFWMSQTLTPIDQI